MLISGLLMLMAPACVKELELPVEQADPVRNLEEYRAYVSCGDVATKLTSVDNDGDGYAEWEDDDAIYVALDGDDSKSFKLTYLEEKKYFTISSIGGNADISSTGTVSALYATNCLMTYSSSRLSGEINGDVAYTKTGSCIVDDDAKSIMFNIPLARPVSLIKISGVGGECCISNMRKTFRTLTSLSSMSWEDAAAPSYIYSPSEDAVYCYGLPPESGTLILKYVSGDKKEYTRYASAARTMSAGDMLTLNGPATAEAPAWSEVLPDHYTTGSVYTYSKSTKTKPVTLVVLGDGFTVSDLLTSGCVFYEKAKAAMDKMFSVEPYKTYKNYFNVYFIAAVSNERGADISSLNQVRDTYFNTGWESGKSYTNMAQTGVADFVKKYCPDVVSGKTALGDVRILLLCNETTYGAVCLPYSSPSYCIVSLTGSNSLAWNNYDKSIAGQTRGDYTNLVLHEFGGHEIGRLGDEYSGALTSTSKVVTYHLRDFGWNLSISQDSSAPWYDFLQAITADGGYDVDTSNYRGLGFYKCGSIDIYRPSFASCMQDNRLFYDAWSRYLISEEIHARCGESYSVQQFMNEVPKKLSDPTWLVTRAPEYAGPVLECPMPAPPAIE